MMLLTLLWFINILSLVLYALMEKWNGFLILAIVGVALTGIIPGVYGCLFGDDKTEQNKISPRRLLHVVVGVIGAVGTGLALGHAIRKGKTPDNLYVLVFGVVVNIASGTVAHLIFVREDKVYKNKSAAYGLLSRFDWYVWAFTIVSLLCLGLHGLDDNMGAIDSPERLFISPVVHFIAFAVLAVMEGYRDEYETSTRSLFLMSAINYTILNTAAVVSMMALKISVVVLDKSPIHFIADLIQAFVVYLYLVLVHC